MPRDSPHIVQLCCATGTILCLSWWELTAMRSTAYIAQLSERAHAFSARRYYIFGVPYTRLRICLVGELMVSRF